MIINIEKIQGKTKKKIHPLEELGPSSVTLPRRPRTSPAPCPFSRGQTGPVRGPQLLHFSRISPHLLWKSRPERDRSIRPYILSGCPSILSVVSVRSIQKTYTLICSAHLPFEYTFARHEPVPVRSPCCLHNSSTTIFPVLCSSSF